jgi:hypothetical protein
MIFVGSFGMRSSFLDAWNKGSGKNMIANPNLAAKYFSG